MNSNSTEILTGYRANPVIGMPVNPVYGGVDDSCHSQQPPKTKQILIGWDKSKSYTMMGLLVCFVLWAAIFFPLAL